MLDITIWNAELIFFFIFAGFDNGINFSQFANDNVNDANDVREEDAGDVIVNLASLLTLTDNDALGIWLQVDNDTKTDVTISRQNDKNENGESKVSGDANFDALVFDSGPVLAISDAGQAIPQGSRTREWAELLDVSQPIQDFHQKVPQMAYTW